MINNKTPPINKRRKTNHLHPPFFLFHLLLFFLPSLLSFYLSSLYTPLSLTNHHTNHNFISFSFLFFFVIPQFKFKPYMSTSLDPHLMTSMTTSTILQSPKDSNKHNSKTFSDVEEKKEDEECKTPTSKESKIPLVPTTCPPAPRKPRTIIRCKRRLSELDFFVVPQPDIECFFLPQPKKFRHLPLSN